MAENSDLPPVCDYEGSDYNARFWESGERAYEDQVERVALRRLMPPKGDTLIDLETGSAWDVIRGLAISGSMEGTSLRAVPSLSSFDWAWEDFYPDSAFYTP